MFLSGTERSTCIGSSSEGAILVTTGSGRYESQPGVSIVSRCISFVAFGKWYFYEDNGAGVSGAIGLYAPYVGLAFKSATFARVVQNAFDPLFTLSLVAPRQRVPGLLS